MQNWVFPKLPQLVFGASLMVLTACGDTVTSSSNSGQNLGQDAALESDKEAHQNIADFEYVTIPQAAELGAESALDKALERMEAVDISGPNIQSVLALNPNARDMAKALDEERANGTIRSPLHGVPVLIKDNIESLDPLPTTAGSLALVDNFTNKDAPLTAGLRDAGAVIMGKTNLSQWANFRSTGSSSGWSAVRGQTKNPHALNRSPCGSSSGSGAAVAAGIVAAAVGTETNGSVICPSAMNGIVGFKPTVGVIPQTGIVPLAFTQDTAGPMTITVEDAAIMMDAMTNSGSDYRDAALAGSLQGIRIGVMEFARGPNAGVGENFDAVLETLKAQGAILVTIEEFDTPDGFGDASFDILKYEFKHSINEYLAAAPAAVKSRSLNDIMSFQDNSPEEMAVFNYDIHTMSNELGGLDDPKYIAALELVTTATRQNGIDKMLSDNNVSFLVAPSTAPTFLVDHIYGDSYPGGTGAGWIAAIAGYPHITVPMGDVKGLPVGVSFMGAKDEDKAVMAIGYAYEQASQKFFTPKFESSVETRPAGRVLGEKP